MLPYVIIHNSVSVDGRVNGFSPDIGLHYETAANWEFQAHLVGSETLVAMESSELGNDTLWLRYQIKSDR